MAKRINNNETYHRYMEAHDEHWYFIYFQKSGKANFYIKPGRSNMDIDLFVYKSDKDTMLGRSRKGSGKDDIVFDIPVRTDEKYYIKVKHYSGSEGLFELRAKVYPDNSSIFDGKASVNFHNGVFNGISVGGYSKSLSSYARNYERRLQSI